MTTSPKLIEPTLCDRHRRELEERIAAAPEKAVWTQHCCRNVYAVHWGDGRTEVYSHIDEEGARIRNGAILAHLTALQIAAGAPGGKPN